MKGGHLNLAIRKTRTCMIDALDEELKASIRAHGTKFGLKDIEFSILMCCETITVHRKKGFWGGIKTTLLAVYGTPKWLVWADSNGRNDVAAGTAQLSQIDVGNYRATAQYAIMPNQGLSVTGIYTDKSTGGSLFIVLEAEADGREFRKILMNTLHTSKMTR